MSQDELLKELKTASAVWKCSLLYAQEEFQELLLHKTLWSVIWLTTISPLTDWEYEGESGLSMSILLRWNYYNVSKETLKNDCRVERHNSEEYVSI